MTFWLGVALAAEAGIRLHAVVQMSNHLHLVLTDTDSRLAAFMNHFVGSLAKTINKLDETSGPCFGRRYAAIEIADDDALLDRIVYTVTNPAAADLVDDAESWGGLCMWQGGNTKVGAARVQQHKYNRKVRSRGVENVDIEAFTERVTVEITPVGRERRDATAALHEAIQARLEDLRAERGARRVLGMRAVLRQKPFDAPKKPKRSPMPLCHASTPDRWRAYREGLRRFVTAYRAASEAFRRGVFDVLFPEYAFRPSTPLLD